MVQSLCPKSLLEFRKLSFGDSRGDVVVDYNTNKKAFQ